MLNLVVESAIHVVIEGMGCDVASSKYLPSQEVHLGIFFQNEHTFVVRSESRTQVKAKEGLIDKNKDYPLPEIQLGKDQAEVEDKVKDYEREFSRAVLDFILYQVHDTGTLKIYPDKGD